MKIQAIPDIIRENEYIMSAIHCEDWYCVDIRVFDEIQKCLEKNDKKKAYDMMFFRNRLFIYDDKGAFMNKFFEKEVVFEAKKLKKRRR